MESRSRAGDWPHKGSQFRGLYPSTYLLAEAATAKPTAREQLIIDTDPGIDDVVAILMALQDPRVTVMGITVVRGNTELQNALVNTLKILSVAGKTNIPVYAGAEGGLAKTLPIDNYFGEDGLRDGPWRVQPSLDKVQTEPAAAYLAKSVKQSPGKITVICLGPLTNIALAIHLNPSFLHQVKRLVFLGGSVRGKGDTAPGAEFNMYADPDAAAFVLDKALTAGVLITQVPMETVTHTDLTKDWRWNTVAKLKNRVVEFLNKIESEQDRQWPESFYHPHGVFAVAAVLDEKSVLGLETLHGTVETKATRSSGKVMDDRINLSSYAPNLQVVTQVSDIIIKQLMYTNLAKYI